MDPHDGRTSHNLHTAMIPRGTSDDVKKAFLHLLAVMDFSFFDRH